MSDLPPWPNRVREEANLFNPFFLALTIRQVAKGYREQRKEALPWALPFLSTPLLLHAHTRDQLPYTSRTDLVVWLTDHPDIRFLTPERVRKLQPHVREAILVGARDAILGVDRKSLAINVGAARITQARIDRTRSTAGDTLKAAPKLGRWLANNGSWQHQMTLWGITL